MHWRSLFLCAMLGVVVAQGLLSPGDGIARVVAPGVLRLPGRSVSVAAPKFSASPAPSLGKASLDVTLDSVGPGPVAVAPSDFKLSAQGDMFAVQKWNAGRAPIRIAPGHSRTVRLTFGVTSAVVEQGALFYRPADGNDSGVAPLNGALAVSDPPTSPQSTQQPIVNTFWMTHGVGDPWGTAIDSSGKIWFAEPGCDFAPTCEANTPPGQIGKFDPSSGAFTYYTLPSIPGNQPIFVAFDGSGHLWFTTPNNSMIGEFSPTTGMFIGQWPVTAGSGPWDLTFANGQLWYTEHLVSAVGTFNPATHAHQDFQTPSANSNPYGIAASGGLIWFTENNSSVDRVALLDTTQGNAISEYPIVQPPTGGTPHLIVVGANGHPWWTEGWSNTIATLDPAAATPGSCGATSGTCNGVQQFQLPSSSTCGSSTHTSGIALDAAANRVWVDNSLTAQVGSFAPSTQTFAMTTLSDCSAHPHDGLNVDSAGNVWFDEEFANAIGELIPPGGSVAGAPLGIAITPNPPVSGSDVKFTASWANPAGIANVKWSFGDGTSAVGNPVSHRYAVAGSETLTALVEDNDGNKAQMRESISVAPQPPVDTSPPANSVSPPAGQTFTVTNLPPVNTAAPTIRGSPTQAHTLTAEKGSWTNEPSAFSYMWQRCHPGCANIAAATGDSYKLAAGDIDAKVRVIVTAGNAGGSAQAESRGLGPVGPSLERVKGALSQLLAASTKGWTITKLLEKGGYTGAFHAPSGGRLMISWHARSVLMATARRGFSKAGAANVTIRLTRIGKRVLKRASKLTVAAKVVFIPAGEQAVTSLKRFTLSAR